MPEEVLFTFERRMDRAEVADYLRSVADALDGGEGLSLATGSESVTMEPPARPTFEVTAEREVEGDGAAELSVEFELEWDEGESEDGGDGDLRIN